MNKKKRIINYKKFIASCTILIIIICLIGFGIKKITSKIISNVKNVETVSNEVIIPEDKTINLVAIGDVINIGNDFKGNLASIYGIFL